MIEPYKGIIYDPACGSGGMFVQSIKFIEAHHGNKKETNPKTSIWIHGNAKQHHLVQGLLTEGEKTVTSWLYKTEPLAE